MQIQNPTISGSLYITGQSYQGFTTVVVSASQTAATINFNNGNFQQLSLTGSTVYDLTCSITNFKAGASYSVLTIQSPFSTSLCFSSTLGFVLYSSGTLPVWSTVSNEKDILSLVCDGSNLYGVLATQFK